MGHDTGRTVGNWLEGVGAAAVTKKSSRGESFISAPKGSVEAWKMGEAAWLRANSSVGFHLYSLLTQTDTNQTSGIPVGVQKTIQPMR